MLSRSILFFLNRKGSLWQALAVLMWPFSVALGLGGAGQVVRSHPATSDNNRRKTKGSRHRFLSATPQLTDAILIKFSAYGFTKA